MTSEGVCLPAMKAAVLHEFKQPLSVERTSDPKPADGEVLVRVEACGVCHSDIHIADGDWPQFTPIVKKPLILGHEVVGRVVDKGKSVTALQTGDRVGMPWIYWTCGECEPCREGNENLCLRQIITGVSVDGGFAELFRAPASHVLRIPEKLSSNEAAPLFCAGVTVYRALMQAEIHPTQRLAVFGVGGLGHMAVQLGRELGAEVIAIDVVEQKLELAESLGASAVINAATTDAGRQLRKQGGVHVALVTSAARATYDSAFQALRPAGTLLVVGLPAENICFPPILMASKEVRIRASAVGTRENVIQVLRLAEAGKIRCLVSIRELDQANEALRELRSGAVSGRLVLNLN
jgi:propanol-preferring alcohol dehydrogenase